MGWSNMTIPSVSRSERPVFPCGIGSCGLQGQPYPEISKDRRRREPRWNGTYASLR
jgi:hypothetical protein